LSQVRGTVQADILKEDPQKILAFSTTEFALRLMGDVQIFHQKNVRTLFGFNIRVSYC
jgi:methylmalonyl-CoA mutase N-terminal domain/subunit